jgi:tRNA threonylcarbamoyladenosine dehydratase
MDLPLTPDTRSLPGAPSSPVPEPGSVGVETPYYTHRRFDRAARLFGEPGLHRLMAARVMIVGVGGVGSFAAEALVRSGVGRIALVDFDKVCVTNTNRQLHAMKGTVGQRKVEVMADRLRSIHPGVSVEPVPEFYDAGSSARILDGPLDFVVDAIDNLTAKAHLLATCLRRQIPVVSCMGAAARLDPTQIRVDDLCHTKGDPFARALRKILRSEHGFEFDKDHPIGVAAVFSTEEPIPPTPPTYDEGTGFRCVCPGGKNGKHDCDRRARIDGTAAFVTGSFGLTAASVVVRRLLAPV